MPQLSIIIPVFNAKETLFRAVNSIINQTFHDWEVLLIDDGSSDASGKICDSFADDYCNIFSFHQKNQGLSSARNVGVLNARGEYLAFLDADDWVEPDYYFYMMGVMKVNNLELLMSGYTREFWKNGACRRCISNAPRKNSILRTDSDIADFLGSDFSYNLFIHVWNKLYLRSTLERMSIFFDENLRFAEDVSFNLDYLRQITKIGIVKQQGYHYVCLNKESLTAKWMPDLIEVNCHTYRCLCDYFKKFYSFSGLRTIQNMYLKGCALNVEKAILAKQSYKQVLEVVQNIKQADETQEILAFSFWYKKERVEFKLYRISFQILPDVFIPLAVYGKILIKRILRRL